jgi:hypothetical protein
MNLFDLIIFGLCIAGVLSIWWERRAEKRDRILQRLKLYEGSHGELDS